MRPGPSVGVDDRRAVRRARSRRRVEHDGGELAGLCENRSVIGTRTGRRSQRISGCRLLRMDARTRAPERDETRAGTRGDSTTPDRDGRCRRSDDACCWMSATRMATQIVPPPGYSARSAFWRRRQASMVCFRPPLRGMDLDPLALVPRQFGRRQRLRADGRGVVWTWNVNLPVVVARSASPTSTLSGCRRRPLGRRTSSAAAGRRQLWPSRQAAAAVPADSNTRSSGRHGEQHGGNRTDPKGRRRLPNRLPASQPGGVTGSSHPAVGATPAGIKAEHNPDATGVRWPLE